MPCDCRRLRRAGFTLVELLVALAIFALIGVLGWRALEGILRARETLTTDMEQFRGMQLTFAQLQSDCAQVVSLADFPAHPTILASKNSIIMLRSVSYDNQAEQFEVVSYRFVQGVLTRQESPASRDLATIEQAWNTALVAADTGPAVRVLSGLDVAAMRLLQDPAVGLEVELRIRGRKASISKTILVGQG